MKLIDMLEAIIYGGPMQPGPGLPPPVAQRPVKREIPKPVGGRLANPATNTWEWDIKPRANVNADADTTLTNREIELLIGAKCKNGPWNASLKVSRVRGATIAEAAKAAGCSTSYAGKAYSIFSQCE